MHGKDFWPTKLIYFPHTASIIFQGCNNCSSTINNNQLHTPNRSTSATPPRCRTNFICSRLTTSDVYDVVTPVFSEHIDVFYVVSYVAFFDTPCFGTMIDMYCNVVSLGVESRAVRQVSIHNGAFVLHLDFSQPFIGRCLM